MVLGNSETIPVTGGRLALGTWQARRGGASRGRCAGGRAGGRAGCVRAGVQWAVAELGAGGRWRATARSLAGSGRATSSRPHMAVLLFLLPQSVMLVELDGARARTVGVQVVGVTSPAPAAG